ncbi:MAG TPA: hypothetical protein DDX19_10310 [Rhodopirellula baltica]|uniref:Uncharacterized protein n=1 Tax=Rhodopirellula baltica (strain DSM 10527 / NCIMB 13988 / SH1) TaxID=243090 RepID=Q7UH01_RHOBA|nr:hypothetical protein RB4920 [Rhodopirellula baltica SH 1]HBE63114.1 hypothetical protein [Rhodopirellula baltica]
MTTKLINQLPSEYLAPQSQPKTDSLHQVSLQLVERAATGRSIAGCPVEDSPADDCFLVQWCDCLRINSP